jgi:hypothetical protein
MTSKIKVDNIENQCGGAVVTKCGATTTISGSVVKADDIQAADGGNLINQCGTTITLGASGDTINLASGASQTGFGRTGTVDWDTTAKTAGFTAVSGTGYFVNTTSGAITMNLPASPSAGDIVAVKDYANTFDTNNLVIDRNGSVIDGVANNFEVTAEGQSLTLVYVDGTRGWVPTDAAKASDFAEQALFITATGGTITTCGDYKIHTFTSPGTFCVSVTGNGPTVPTGGPSNVDYLVVAGGGGGGGGHGGGGGGGGYRTTFPSPGCNAGAFPISATTYPITVGAGGSGTCYNSASPASGSNSIFSSITSSAGGGGGSGVNFPNGESGGSGGGGNGGYNPSSGGTGNTPPVSPPQGNTGGSSFGPTVSNYAGGGGGGIGGSGSGAGPNAGGNAGGGTTNSISGSPVHYSGGGGGGSGACGATGGTGGTPSGVPGKGGNNPGIGPSAPANQGGGAGGGGANPGGGTGGNGGSGIVVIRYKFQ